MSLCSLCSTWSKCSSFGICVSLNYVFWSPYKSQIAHIRYKVYVRMSIYPIIYIYIIIYIIYMYIFDLFVFIYIHTIYIQHIIPFTYLYVYLYILLSIIVPLLYQCCFVPSWRSSFSSRILIWAQGVELYVGELYQLKTLGWPPGSGTFNQGKWGKPAFRKGIFQLMAAKYQRHVWGYLALVQSRTVEGFQT